MLIFTHKEKIFWEIIMEGVLFIIGFACLAFLAFMNSKHSTKASKANNDDFNSHDTRVNPATGLPMLSGTIDVGGHVFGSQD